MPQKKQQEAEGLIIYLKTVPEILQYQDFPGFFFLYSCELDTDKLFAINRRTSPLRLAIRPPAGHRNDHRD